MAVIAASAVALRIALTAAHWDTYGALQLPLVFEAVAAAAITVSTASPFGEPERVAGRWLPVLRLAAALALTGLAAGLLAGLYALYTQWHPPALHTPWLWPARPPHDLGGAVCAGLVFLAGLAVTAVRGARDPAGE